MSPGFTAHIGQRPIARRATRPTRLRHKPNNEHGRVAGRTTDVSHRRDNARRTFCSARVLLLTVLLCRWVICGDFYTQQRAAAGGP